MGGFSFSIGEQGSGRSQIVVKSIEDVMQWVSPLEEQALENPTLILIGGCSRTGKSWLAHAVSERLAAAGVPCLILGLDAWLVSLEKRPVGSQVIKRYDCAAIERDATELLRGWPINPPVYDPRTRQRVSEASSEPVRIVRGIVIVEGVIALALPHLREEAALKVYVTVEDSTRWARLLSFYCDVKGVELSEAERILREREVEEVPFVRATRAWADLVFQADGRNEQ